MQNRGHLKGSIVQAMDFGPPESNASGTFILLISLNKFVFLPKQQSRKEIKIWKKSNGQFLFDEIAAKQKIIQETPGFSLTLH